MDAINPNYNTYTHMHRSYKVQPEMYILFHQYQIKYNKSLQIIHTLHIFAYTSRIMRRHASFYGGLLAHISLSKRS